MSKPSPAPVRVVVVNFNSGDWLDRCVTALRQSSAPLALSVVDNGSEDQSLDYCRQLAASGTDDVQFNPGNRGFGAACNQVALGCDEDYVCFLNPDCQVAPDTLEQMVSALDQEPRAALCGAMVVGVDGQVQRGTLRRLPAPAATLVTALGLERLGLKGINAPGQPPTGRVAVEAVSGALMLARSKPLRAAGGFDEGYFLHCEDLDLFARLRQLGWTVVLEPSARAIHAKGVCHRRHPLAAHRRKHASLKRYFQRHVAGSMVTSWLWWLGIELHFLATAPFHLRPRHGG